MKKELEGILGKIPQDQNLTFNQKMLYLKEATTQILELVESKIPSEQELARIIEKRFADVFNIVDAEDKETIYTAQMGLVIAKAIRAEVVKEITREDK